MGSGGQGGCSVRTSACARRCPSLPPRLSHLDASSNRLASLSLRAPGLATLLLGKNQLESLDLTGCPQLTELSAPFNGLEALPRGAGGLTSLATIDLSSNKLASGLEDLIGNITLTLSPLL